MITIDNQPIVAPTDVGLGIFRLTKASRAADGTMNMEIIAVKRQLTLKWAKIAEPDLRSVLNILDAGVFHAVAFPDPQAPDGQATKTMYVGDIDQNLWHRVNGVRYWDNVSLGLIER